PIRDALHCPAVKRGNRHRHQQHDQKDEGHRGKPDRNQNQERDQGDEAADHENVAMGKIDHADDAVDHGVTDGDQAIDRTKDNAIDQLLGEIIHTLPSVGAFSGKLGSASPRGEGCYQRPTRPMAWPSDAMTSFSNSGNSVRQQRRSEANRLYKDTFLPRDVSGLGAADRTTSSGATKNQFRSYPVLNPAKETAMSNPNQNPGQQNQNPGQKPGQQQGGGQKPGQQQQDPNRQGQKPGQQGKGE